MLSQIDYIFSCGLLAFIKHDIFVQYKWNRKSPKKYVIFNLLNSHYTQYMTYQNCDTAH